MTPLSHRLSVAESELAAVKEKTQTLSQTLRTIKRELKDEKLSLTQPPKISPSLSEKSQVSPSPPKSQAPPAPNLPALKETRPIRNKAAQFEMQLGRVWFVRLGILLLTTGFVFLSRYTYEHFIHDISPGLRLSGMYLLSMVLTAAGLFFETWKESLKNYGRVVAAGGLAAIYYCGFASYHVDALRVIDSPFVASLIMSLSAALCCAVSLWRSSRVMLSGSLALAFYSISINPIGWMACLSALTLASFGVLMMLRYRWVELGFIVLLGSYLSFFFWQVAISPNDNSIARYYLIAYWLLFTFTALIPRLSISEKRHTLFSSINNTAFFFLFAFQFEAWEWMSGHSFFCLLFGAILISLGLISKGRFPEKLRLIHLIKGLGLITLGITLHLSGHQLFMALLIEALVLMALNTRQRHPITECGSWAIALLSCLSLAAVSLTEIPTPALFLGAFAWFTLSVLQGLCAPSRVHYGSLSAAMIGTLFLSFVTTAGWGLDNRILCLAVLGTLSSFIILSGKARTFFTELLLVFITASFFAYLSVLIIPALSLHSGVTQLILATTALLTSLPPLFFLHRTTEEKIQTTGHLVLALFLAAAVIFLALALLQGYLTPFLTLFITLCIPIIGSLAARKSGLLAHSLIPFANYVIVLQVPYSDYTFPITLMMSSLHFCYVAKHHHLADRSFILHSLFVIAIASWGGLLHQVLSQPALPFILTGVSLLLLARRYSPKFISIISLPYFMLGFASALNHSSELYHCLIPPMALHLIFSVKKAPSRYQVLGSTCLLLLWAKMTHDISIFPLTAVWTLLGSTALLAGLAFNSRCYRLLALVILIFSLGHLMIFDLGSLAPLPRILSFMTLGLGLLGLGYVYNRYQERLKEIL